MATGSVETKTELRDTISRTEDVVCAIEQKLRILLPEKEGVSTITNASVLGSIHSRLQKIETRTRAILETISIL